MFRVFRAAQSALGERLRSEAGFTLPELMVGLFVGAILAAAGLVFVVVSSRQFAGQQDRVSATDDARNALASMTAELRDATSVRLVDQRTVDATVRATDGSLSNIRYACTTASEGLSECTRTETGTGDSRFLIEGVANQDNFSVVSGSDLTGTSSLNGALRLSFAMKLSEVTNPENPINLVSTVKPRNCVTSPGPGVLNPAC